MTAWQDVERAEPEFARRVRGLFDGHRHKTIATLRADGSPRISGIEVAFEDGELAFGSMPNARKGADLGRDPRFALHSATIDPVEGAEAQWPGEAKISGRAIYARPLTEGSDGDRFYADIAEVVHTHLNEKATMLVVEWWTPTRGLRRIERELSPAAGSLQPASQGPGSRLVSAPAASAATLQTRAAELEHLRLSAAEHLDERDRLLFEHALTRLHAELDWHHQLHSALSRGVTPQPRGEQQL
jgi:hypothetical protein